MKTSDISFSGVSISEAGFKALQKRSWSGNVRELQNAIERLSILSQSDVIDKQTVNDILESKSESDDLEDMGYKIENFQDFKEKVERVFLVKQLEKNDWNISQTADAIGLQRSHIYTKMKKYNIER